MEFGEFDWQLCRLRYVTLKLARRRKGSHAIILGQEPSVKGKLRVEVAVHLVYRCFRGTSKENNYSCVGVPDFDTCPLVGDVRGEFMRTLVHIN